MPLALEPGGRFPVVLKSDQDKPECERPTFYFRALNGRKWREAAGLLDTIDEAKNGFEAFDRVFNAVKIGLVDWSNMNDPETGEAIPYDQDSLDLIVGSSEAVELLHEMLAVGRAPRKN